MTGMNDSRLLGVIDNISTDWRDILCGLIAGQPHSRMLCLEEALEQGDFYPPPDMIFRCFGYFNFERTRVVILGQDPYISEGEAMGLSFSVPGDCVKIPRSLQNIFKEMNSDLGLKPSDPTYRCAEKGGCLEDLAEQGVLLLNAALTVAAGQSGSHMKHWGGLVDGVILHISEEMSRPVVFMLWGNFARSKKKLISPKHFVLEATHPSPLSANRGGFFGCKHFSKCNELLDETIFK